MPACLMLQRAYSLTAAAGVSDADTLYPWGHMEWEFQWYDVDSLVQDCSISIESAMEILQSCTKPSSHGHVKWHHHSTNTTSLRQTNVGTPLWMPLYLWCTFSATSQHSPGVCMSFHFARFAFSDVTEIRPIVTGSLSWTWASCNRPSSLPLPTTTVPASSQNIQKSFKIFASSNSGWMSWENNRLWWMPCILKICVE